MDDIIFFKDDKRLLENFKTSKKILILNEPHTSLKMWKSSRIYEINQRILNGIIKNFFEEIEPRSGNILELYSITRVIHFETKDLAYKIRYNLTN